MATIVTEQHQPWCTEHGQMPDGSGSWCRHEVGDRVVLADDGPNTPVVVYLDEDRMPLAEAREVVHALVSAVESAGAAK